jgi:hypothetical protein
VDNELLLLSSWTRQTHPLQNLQKNIYPTKSIAIPEPGDIISALVPLV